MIPTLIGSSVAQINLLVDTAIATLLDEGSNYWLYLSDRLLEFPLGVFAIALSTVILPGLSQRFAGGDREGFGRSLDWGLRLTWVIALPAAAGLFVLSTPLISTLFEHDQFDAYGTSMAALSLGALAFGLPAWMLIKVLAPAFYSRQDTRSPVKAAVVAMLANVVLNLVIVFVVMDQSAPGRHAGLALASSLSGWLNLSLLWIFLIRGGYYQTDYKWLGDWVRVGVATAGMVVALFWRLPPPDQWTGWVWYERLLELGLLVGLGVAVYAGLLVALRLRFRALIDRP
jgi:putative peptidoglycan lipid II flippase